MTNLLLALVLLLLVGCKPIVKATATINVIVNGKTNTFTTIKEAAPYMTNGATVEFSDGTFTY